MPPRFAQFAWVAVTFAAVIYIFTSPHGGDGASIIPSARRHAMPEISMPDLTGVTWKLSQHRGHVVLVNFWASWCGPCRAEVPGLIRLSKAQPDFEIAGIAIHDEEADTRRFAAETGMPYAVLLSPATSIWDQALEGLPTSFLVDKQGRIARQYVGAVSEGLMRSDIARISAEP